MNVFSFDLIIAFSSLQSPFQQRHLLYGFVCHPLDSVKFGEKHGEKTNLASFHIKYWLLYDLFSI